MESFMSAYQTYSRRRFVRSADRAMIAGVCAGLANYFGFNLRATRFLAVVALCMAFPITIVTYFAAVLFIPSQHDPERQPGHDPEFDQALRSSPRQTMIDVRRKCQTLDSRLARLERYVTSPRFKLDQEFKKL